MSPVRSKCCVKRREDRQPDRLRLTCSHDSVCRLRRSFPDLRSRPERRSSFGRDGSRRPRRLRPDRRSRPDRLSRPERRSPVPDSPRVAACRSASSRSMSAVDRLFSRSRIRSRSSSRSLWNSSLALTARASVSTSARRTSTIASASSRLPATPIGVHTPGRRNVPCCRHRRTMTTKSRLPRIVPPSWHTTRPFFLPGRAPAGFYVRKVL